MGYPSIEQEMRYQFSYRLEVGPLSLGWCLWITIYDGSVTGRWPISWVNHNSLMFRMISNNLLFRLFYTYVTFKKLHHIIYPRPSIKNNNKCLSVVSSENFFSNFVFDFYLELIGLALCESKWVLNVKCFWYYLNVFLASS